MQQVAKTGQEIPEILGFYDHGIIMLWTSFWRLFNRPLFSLFGKRGLENRLGRRCLRRNELKKKTQFLFSDWFKMSKTNKYVVHKVNTFFLQCEIWKILSHFISWQVGYINSWNCAIYFFFNLYLITTWKVAPGLKRLPEFCQDVLQWNLSFVAKNLKANYMISKSTCK